MDILSAFVILICVLCGMKVIIHTITEHYKHKRDEQIKTILNHLECEELEESDVEYLQPKHDKSRQTTKHSS